MICPFCNGPVNWSSRKMDFNDSGMNPVSLRTLACRNASCLIKPGAGYENFEWVGLPRAKDVEGARGGYIPVDRDAEFEAFWLKSQ